MNDGPSYDQAFKDLRDVYLEDSWIFDIVVTATTVRFKLDAVLTPGHPEYQKPDGTEQHCYRLGHLTIAG